MKAIKRTIFFCALLLMILLFGISVFAADTKQEPAPQRDVSKILYYDDTMTEDELDEWMFTTPGGKWYAWKHKDEDHTRGFDRSLRYLYANDPELIIDNHIVYCKSTFNNQDYCYIVDYFDSDEAEAAATELFLPKEVQGIPVVGTSMYFEGEDDYYSGGYKNDQVKIITIEDGWTSVDLYAFSNFTALKYVELPDSVTTIEQGAFNDCGKLRAVLGGNLKSIDSWAFRNCQALKTFPALKNVTTLQDLSFMNCGFTELTLSGDLDYNIRELGAVFEKCTALKKVSFTAPTNKNRVFLICSEMFANCTALESVTLPGGYKRGIIGFSAFYGCTALKNLSIPKDFDSVCICETAFEGCKRLAAIQNSEAIKRVGSQAFNGCKSLKTITFSAQLDYVVDDAFSGCTNLKTIYLNSTKSSIFNKHNWDADIENYDHNKDALAPLEKDGEGTVACNFTKYLPKTCTVYVTTKAMKQAVQKTGCPGTVKIKVSVAAPKTFKAAKKSGKVTLTWSAVKSVTGYRIFSYNAKTGTYTKLKTLKSGTTRITLSTKATQFAIRAYRTIDKDVSWSAIKMSNKVK